MAVQAALPPYLTSDDIHAIFEDLNVYLNCTILQALMHGKLHSLCMSHSGASKLYQNTSIGRYAMVLAILALYILATIELGEFWADIHHAFIDEGQNCLMVYKQLNESTPTGYQLRLTTGITACISTFIADFSLIWQCWIVWGCQWLVVIIPVLSTILSTVFKSLQTYHVSNDITKAIEDSTYSSAVSEWKMIYLALTVTTTL
ncbi:hypothetical protein EDD85DRAFT_955483 [Armillaria nabsnona]|nr:hypothetical protein EDD85DRAFT_955483 [Armillaria nabsnona]